MEHVMKFLQAVFLCVFLGGSVFGASPDFRPAFDKTAYRGTIWTQVNPWWHPGKQRVDDSGGPNYAFKEHRPYEEWGSAFADLCKDGTVNLQIELHVPAPGYANGMKIMMKQAKEKKVDAKFAIFLVYYGKKNVEADIQKTIAQLDMLKEELKNDPAIFRVDGHPVISVYTGGYFTPEEWGKVIPAVEKKCGRFIWLLNTCRNPALDSDKVECAQWVRSRLPYFDGVSQYGNYSKESQQAHYEILAPIMHNEYPQKIFEASIQNAYSNHFHMGGVATHLSEKWRKSVESSLAAGPDSFVMTNFFDHYENSLVLPCYEREDFLIRYAMAALADWRKAEFIPEKTPELVLTNYTTILLGSQNLDFEVIGFPIDSRQKKVTLMLDVCDTSGKVLHAFPATEMDLSRLSVKEFSLPSEQFFNERGIVPHLRYKWDGREYALPYNPMTLVSPSIRPNWMFWARSTRNTLKCNVVNPRWSINGVGPGGTLLWPKDGSVAITAEVKAVWGPDPRGRNGSGFFRILRNGLEWYRLAKYEGMNFTRAYNLPSPAEALNYYHLEYENPNGYKYATLPVWVTGGQRPGTVRIPIRCGKESRIFEIEAARVPFFYYPCDRDEGALLIDRSGYMHNGRLNGTGYGGGHLGYTGYHYYHNGGVAPIDHSPFRTDPDGRGMLRFDGKNYIMIMGGTAFPGASTYEISIRPAAIGEKMGIFGTANNQINLWIESDGRLVLTHGSETEGEGGSRPVRSFIAKVVSKSKLEKERWYRIAAVYDLTNLKLYINGKLEGECKAPPSSGHNSINHLVVGSLCEWLFKPKTFFKGDLREIRIYGRNLSPDEFLKEPSLQKPGEVRQN